MQSWSLAQEERETGLRYSYRSCNIIIQSCNIIIRTLEEEIVMNLSSFSQLGMGVFSNIIIRTFINFLHFSTLHPILRQKKALWNYSFLLWAWLYADDESRYLYFPIWVLTEAKLIKTFLRFWVLIMKTEEFDLTYCSSTMIKWSSGAF